MDKILGNVFNVVPVRGILSIYCSLALRQPDAFNVCGVGVFFVAVGYICEIRARQAISTHHVLILFRYCDLLFFR